MARRKAKKGSRRRSTTKSLSLTKIAQLGWSYKTVTGNDIGSVMSQLFAAVKDGNVDMVDVLMTELEQTVLRVTADPVGIAIRTGVGVAGFGYIGKLIGHKTIFRLGKWRLTT